MGQFEIQKNTEAEVGFTHYQSQYIAHLLTLKGNPEAEISRSIKRARVDMNPHQVDAALFALRSPISKGVVLADEVGLGKTIEASLVIAQKWAERKRRILLVVPASLRKQWSQELQEKFSLPSAILESKNFNVAAKSGALNPFEINDKIVMCSYQFASGKADYVSRVLWDLVVFDEAHKLRNIFKKEGAKIAKRLRDATQGRHKLLLTATPLQNTLMELYGLVSVIDEHFFGSQAAFRGQYTTGRNAINLPILRERMKTICQRTLRKQVVEAGLLPFTNRYLITEDYTPSDNEQDLYERVSGYLQRPETVGIGQNGRHLVTLVIRKILASSSFAVGETLKKMIGRLEKNLALTADDLADYETVDETAEEMGLDQEAPENLTDAQKLKLEIEELKAMRELALGIRDNAKGQALVKALGSALAQVVEKGGERKAVIFTESVRTQHYIKELLSANGYEGQIVLLNGSNNDPDSRCIYKAWVEKHQGTDVISGSRTADMKAAIVDAFRDDATIFIATESGAEGINLQFCSFVINYDLPWNPQRVEQRIGRCHRYGQKIDVAVLNFINQKNRADQRVFQLLNEKFQLFDGVFGSSDEVLSTIESGVDIEQKILAIYQKCRSADEVDAEFEKLQEELRESIDAQDRVTKRALLETVDETVIQRLRMRQKDTCRFSSDYDRRLLNITKAELPTLRFINSHRFEHDGQIYSLEWPEADENGWHFYRIAEGTLAETLVNQAKNRSLGSACLRFHYEAYDGDGQLSDLIPLREKSGTLRAMKLSVTNAVSLTEHLVLSGVTDAGETLHQDQLHRLLMLPSESAGNFSGSQESPKIEGSQQARIVELLAQAETQNLEYLNEETDKLDRWEEESTAAIDAEIKELRRKANDIDRQSRNPILNLKEKMTLKRQAASYKAESTKRKRSYFEAQERIAEERKHILDRIEAQLEMHHETVPLFTIGWELV